MNNHKIYQDSLNSYKRINAITKFTVDLIQKAEAAGCKEASTAAYRILSFIEYTNHIDISNCEDTDLMIKAFYKRWRSE